MERSLRASAVARRDPDMTYEAADFMIRALKDSTRRTYRTPHRQWLEFAAKHDFLPFPAQEQELLLWATELARRVKYSTVRNYLSAVQTLHEELGYDVSFNAFTIPVLRFK